MAVDETRIATAKDLLALAKHSGEDRDLLELCRVLLNEMITIQEQQRFFSARADVISDQLRDVIHELHNRGKL